MNCTLSLGGLRNKYKKVEKMISIKIFACWNHLLLTRHDLAIDMSQLLPTTQAFYI